MDLELIFIHVYWGGKCMYLSHASQALYYKSDDGAVESCMHVRHVLETSCINIDV